MPINNQPTTHDGTESTEKKNANLAFASNNEISCHPLSKAKYRRVS